MAGLLITLPIAAVIALAFLAFFLWSVRNEDYEDPEMIKYRMLMDEQDQADRSIQPKKQKSHPHSDYSAESSENSSESVRVNADSQDDPGDSRIDAEKPVAGGATGRIS